ncbi:MAG: MBL fold metallo-hydrolase [Muribaculaceae bacterium]|jgi:L-ascorbate metabolism protein UlaG (beta-lactamase superfamily)|nr:MBL fold metallo-hydrolase [Muribaculaceae bacterium]
MTKVTYLDHSGFAVQLPDVLLVFDYFRDPSHALHKILEANPQLPVVFFVSHKHEDHFNTGIYEMAQNHRRVYVMSNDVPAQAIPSTLEVAGMSAGDRIEGLPGGVSVKAYPSTDSGVSFLVETPEGEKIFHAGDLNEWHWKDESKPAEVKHAEVEFTKALNRISSENESVNIAMFPVDPRLGSDFGSGALAFLKAVKTAHFFPMHFWGKKDEAEVFLSKIPADITEVDFIYTPGASMEIK